MSDSSKPRTRLTKQPVVELTVPLYQGVIDDTIARMKAEFVQEGVDE
jgi:hypothetical protein